MNRKIMLFVLLIGMMFFTSIVLGATINRQETFEDDTYGENPSSIWYTYAEMGFDWANINNTGHSGSKSYLINDTDGGTIDTDKSSFNFTSNTYEYFSFWFKWDNTSHNESYGLLDSTDGYILDINFGDDLERIRVYNYTTTCIDRLLDNNSWYKLRFDFNYTTHEVRCRLYNETTLLNDSWIRAEVEAGVVDFTDFISFINYASADDQMFLYFDDLALYKSDTSSSAPGTTTATIPLIPLLGLSVLALLLLAWAIKNPSLDIVLIISIVLCLIFIIAGASVIQSSYAIIGFFW